MPIFAITILFGLALTAGIFLNNAYQQSISAAAAGSHFITMRSLSVGLDIVSSTVEYDTSTGQLNAAAINTTAFEDLRDGWGQQLTLCLNPDPAALAALAVLSGGADQTLSTSCSNALNSAPTNDDIVKVARLNQVVAASTLPAPTSSMVANYAAPCSAQYDLLRKTSATSFTCINLCSLFQEFSVAYDYHATQPSWASCTN
jgi:hypothetical protein